MMGPNAPSAPAATKNAPKLVVSSPASLIIGNSDAFISDQMLAAPPPRPKLSTPPTRRRSQRTSPSVPSKGRCAA
jgi:hypothetical protein